MTRFAIDAPTAARLIREDATPLGAHRLVAPSLLRSEVAAILFREFRAGRLAPDRVRRDLDALAGLQVRVLGDRVSRSTAWRIAAELDWPEIDGAEYLAVASLQADALITDDPRLREAAAGITPLAAYDELFH